MKAYQTKINKLAGSEFKEVHSRAKAIYKQLKGNSKRRPYIRSVYFNKEKVFLDYFWSHLWQKNWLDRTRRLKYYACALDLIKNNKVEPISKYINNRETLHRFTGITPKNEQFFVQITENQKTGRKIFLSVFPLQK